MDYMDWVDYIIGYILVSFVPILYLVIAIIRSKKQHKLHYSIWISAGYWPCWFWVYIVEEHFSDIGSGIGIYSGFDTFLSLHKAISSLVGIVVLLAYIVAIAAPIGMVLHLLILIMNRKKRRKGEISKKRTNAS
jgi:hypothetical protein